MNANAYALLRATSGRPATTQLEELRAEQLTPRHSVVVESTALDGVTWWRASCTTCPARGVGPLLSAALDAAGV